MNSIIAINRGTRVVRSQLASDGEYAVYQNSLTPLGYYEECNRPSNTTFVIGAGAAGEIGYSNEEFWAADDCFCFECPENLSSRYLYHVLMNQHKYIATKVRRSSVPRLSRTVLENLIIPVPELDVQQRVVSILDRFHSLCSDISDGIPAEISARNKQYEYYRNEVFELLKTA